MKGILLAAINAVTKISNQDNKWKLFLKDSIHHNIYIISIKQITGDYWKF